MLLDLAFVPFTLAIALLAGLVVLELVALLMGSSLMMGDGPEGDLADGHFADSHDTGGHDAGGFEADQPDADGHGAEGHMPEAKAPVMVWLASVLLGFGVTGILVQSLASAISGPLPLWVALILATLAGLGFARSFGRRFARALPRVETTATTAQFMGGLQGIVTQGTARRGAAAEVRLRDRHGNLHYLRCEPLSDDDEIPEGTDVTTIRRRRPDGSFELRIIAIS